MRVPEGPASSSRLLRARFLGGCIAAARVNMLGGAFDGFRGAYTYLLHLQKRCPELPGPRLSHETQAAPKFRTFRVVRGWVLQARWTWGRNLCCSGKATSASLRRVETCPEQRTCKRSSFVWHSPVLRPEALEVRSFKYVLLFRVHLSDGLLITAQN